METIVLKIVISKKDGNTYYLIGIPSHKSNINYIWHFISKKLFAYYYNMYSVSKCIEIKNNTTLFMILKKEFSLYDK